ncbi:MAG: lipoyl(octanoyl) transferase LipB [Myxococcota bacterium]
MGRDILTCVTPARYLWLTEPVPYARGHALQRELLEQRIRGDIPDTVLLLQHEETITVGRARGAADSVIAPGDVPVVRVERGGDATWHGPGQLVAYPIVALAGPRADLHDHLRRLEDAVIAVLAARGVRSGRDPRNTGVWIGDGEAARKVCAIGIACRRWVTWHGLALNVAPELARFARIRPCGFAPDTVTRVCDHLAPCPPVEGWVEPLAGALAQALDLAPGSPRAVALREVSSEP